MPSARDARMLDEVFALGAEIDGRGAGYLASRRPPERTPWCRWKRKRPPFT
ncbi:MAG: hypothetical protein ACLR4Z_08555 [Butyricicoccaceae bacterium]